MRPDDEYYPLPRPGECEYDYLARRCSQTSGHASYPWYAERRRKLLRALNRPLTAIETMDALEPGTVMSAELIAAVDAESRGAECAA